MKKFLEKCGKMFLDVEYNAMIAIAMTNKI